MPVNGIKRGAHKWKNREQQLRFFPEAGDSKNTGRHMPAVSDRASCTRANRYFAWTVLVIDAGERLEKGGRGAESGIRVALEARGG